MTNKPRGADRTDPTVGGRELGAEEEREAAGVTTVATCGTNGTKSLQGLKPGSFVVNCVGAEAPHLLKRHAVTENGRQRRPRPRPIEN